MTYNFGDSFDLYTAVADMAPTYWDTQNGNWGVNNAGRFPGSKSLSNGSTASLVKSSGVNDRVHHLAFSFYQTSVMGGTNVGALFVFLDGTTAQCSIGFRQDGAILFYAGSAGTVLATYVNAFALQNTWYAFEFEVVIGSGTTGSFTVRKNGNSIADFTATGLNTQASANAYANKLQLAMVSGSPNGNVDDLFWRSGAATGAWLGDIRCLTRMPASDVSDQFGVAGTRSQTTFGNVPYYNSTAPFSVYAPAVMTWGGSLISVSVFFYSFTATIKCALFLDNAGVPGALIATSPTIVTNPTGAAAAFAFSGVTVAVNQKIWIGLCPSVAPGNFCQMANGTTMAVNTTITYAAFPVANPTVTAGASGTINASLAGAPINSSAVNEPQHDGTATYVYDSNPGDQDFYAIGAAGTSTPFSTIAVITRGFMQKSDAGTRTAAVQLRSGATVVATPTLALSNSGFQWTSRLDLTDPNTSAAWTAAAVSALQVGPTVVT